MAQPPMESRSEYLRLGSRPSLRPAPQALLPYLRLHGIDVGIGKDHTAAAPHPCMPVKSNGRQCHPARFRVAPMRNRKKGSDSIWTKIVELLQVIESGIFSETLQLQR